MGALDLCVSCQGLKASSCNKDADQPAPKHRLINPKSFAVCKCFFCMFFCSVGIPESMSHRQRKFDRH